MRYLIKFSYDGTKFHGFQRQNNERSIQKELELALSNVLNEDIVIKGSGRTDRGVHALGQCAHFDTSKKVFKRDIARVNEILNKDIIIIKTKLVGDNFHARGSVKKKKYVYKINNGIKKEDYEGYYYQIKYDLDINKMKEVAKLFIGTHDFHNFISGERTDYISTILDVKIKRKKNIISIEFIGIGFYRYMVRHLVGAMLDVGRNKASIKDVEEMLNKPEIYKNLSVVPPEGLYLYWVKY